MQYVSRDFVEAQDTAGHLDYALRATDFALRLLPIGKTTIVVYVDAVKVRGQEFSASGRFMRFNKWNEWQDFEPRTETKSQGSHQFQVRHKGGVYGDAPPVATEKIRGTIGRLVASWVSEHGREMDEAETIRLNNAAANAQSDVLDAAVQVGLAQARLNVIEDQIEKWSAEAEQNEMNR